MRLSDINATPRLMGSFAVMIVMTLGVGYLSVTSLGKSNERLETLYKRDMAGSEQANDFSKERLSIGRQTRDGIIHVTEPAVVAADEKAMLDSFVKLHQALDEMEHTTFVIQPGAQIVADIRKDLPAYEQNNHDVYSRLHARNVSGALAALQAVTVLAPSGASVVALDDRSDDSFAEF